MIVSLVASVLIILVGIICSIVQGAKEYKTGRILTAKMCLLITVVVSSVVMFIPIYMENFKTSGCSMFETVIISVHNMIRLFVVDGDFDFITSNLPENGPAWISKLYIGLFAVLFVAAPILTFGFVMSFFKNASAYWKRFIHWNSKMLVFSELNDKSLALAKSYVYESNKNLRKNKKPLIIFTDVFDANGENDYELIEQAKKFGAACFKMDITTVNFSHFGKKREVDFFVIGEDQSENIAQVLKLYNKYEFFNKYTVYLFSTQSESELYLINAYKNSDKSISERITLRRINEVQSLIYHNLYETGYKNIFQSAILNETGEIKQINAIVVGMGLHGTEMTKALTWFGQMDGYSVKIDSFDIDKNAEEKFTSQCPDLMSFSDNKIPTESKYSLSIHSSVDVNTVAFDKLISDLSKTTYIFIALGKDEINLSVSVKLRSLFARTNNYPVIQTVIYNSDTKELLKGIKNFKGQDYNIDFIGDIESSYSKNVLLNSEIEKKALARHKAWGGTEEDFWRYDYNYRASIASVIHKQMKILCQMPGIEKKPSERAEDERLNLRILEHRRWNAYMRSEGYVYGGTIEKQGRNDLAKMHNFLVPFDELPPKEQEKDDD